MASGRWKDHSAVATQTPAGEGLVDSVDLKCPVNVDEKTEVPDEKTEVEEPVGLSQLQLSFSNDFSRLADQFSHMKYATWTAKEAIDEDDDESSDEEEGEEQAFVVVQEGKLGEAVEEQQQAPRQNKEMARETVSDKMLVEQQESQESFAASSTMPSSSTLRIRSRRPSAVSKNSPPRKYTARSYSEMLRVPETRDRLAFYERTFDACMKADSQLAAWISRMKAKGLPQPMTEGYQPPPRRAASPVQQPQETPKLTSSISMFLRKASSSAAVSRRTLTEMPRTSSSRFFLPPSISRLSLSRSTRPKVTPVKQSPKPKTSFSTNQRPPRPPFIKKCSWRDKSTESLRSTATRNTETTTDPCSIPSPHSIKHGFVNAKRTDGALDEMCNVLPNLERRVLEEYLAEAGGDAMTAITLAMTQHKKLAVASSAASMRRISRCQGNTSRARSTRV